MGQLVCRSIMLFEDANMMPHGDQPKLILVQPIFNFIVPFIPTQLSFSVFVATSGLEIGQAYDAEVKLRDDKGEVNEAVPWRIEGPPMQGDVEVEIIEGNALFLTNIKNMVVRNKGRYFVELTVDGIKIGEQYFDIYVKETR